MQRLDSQSTWHRFVRCLLLNKQMIILITKRFTYCHQITCKTNSSTCEKDDECSDIHLLKPFLHHCSDEISAVPHKHQSFNMHRSSMNPWGRGWEIKSTSLRFASSYLQGTQKVFVCILLHIKKNIRTSQGKNIFFIPWCPWRCAHP